MCIRGPGYLIIYLSIIYLLKDIKSALEVIKEPLQLEELVRVHCTLLHLRGGAVLVLEVADDRGHHSVLRVLGEEAPAAAQHAPDVI